MRQLDIEFFWPLSEQIPLDLDYSDCEPKYSYTPLSGSFLISDGMHPLSGSFLISDGSIGGTTSGHLSAGNLFVDVDSTVFKMTKKPNIVRRMLLSTLGIKWEKK
jgi:hypothetical protein